MIECQSRPLMVKEESGRSLRKNVRKENSWKNVSGGNEEGHVVNR